MPDWPDAASSNLLQEIIDLSNNPPQDPKKDEARGLAEACRDTHVPTEKQMTVEDHRASVRRGNRKAKQGDWFGCCMELDHGSGGGGLEASGGEEPPESESYDQKKA